MTSIRVALREAAVHDVDQAISYYVGEAGPAVARRLVLELERAIEQLRAHPASGSPRYGVELDLPGLRCMGLKRFPFLLFYRQEDDLVDVWRVLHAHRDLPEWLRQF